MTELMRDRYEPLEVVGEGGEGRVVKALDRQHGRFVALKIRTVTADSRPRACCSTRHGCCSPSRRTRTSRSSATTSSTATSTSIVMDWVDGIDLGRVLRTTGRPGLAPSSVLAWLAEAAAALTHLHTQDPPVVHGDVKPANLVLTRGGHVVLVDFGAVERDARASAPRSARAATRRPSSSTGAPPSRASDVYSLAATAFTLLTGAPPTGIRAGVGGHRPRAGGRARDRDPRRARDRPGAPTAAPRASSSSACAPAGARRCRPACSRSASPTSRARREVGAATRRRWPRALVRHDELIAETVEAHGGRFLEVDGRGRLDGLGVHRGRAGRRGRDRSATAARGRASGPATSRSRSAWRSTPARPTSAAATTSARRSASPRACAGSPTAGRSSSSGTTAALVARRTCPTARRSSSSVRTACAACTSPVPSSRSPRPASTRRRRPTECPYQGLLAVRRRRHARGSSGASDVVDDLVERLRTRGLRRARRQLGQRQVVGAARRRRARARRARTVMTPGAARRRADRRRHGAARRRPVRGAVHARPRRRRARRASSTACSRYAGPVVIGIRADFYGSCASHPAARRGGRVAPAAARPDDRRRAARGHHRAGAHVRAPGRAGARRPARRARSPASPGALPAALARAAGDVGRARRPHAHPRRVPPHRRRAQPRSRPRPIACSTSLDARPAVARAAGCCCGSSSRATAPRTRADAPRSSEFAGPDDSARSATILDRLADARLVTVDEGSVQLAHEALDPRVAAAPAVARRGPRRVAAPPPPHGGGRRRGSRAGRDAERAVPRAAARRARLEWRASGPALSTTEEEFLDASVADQERAAARPGPDEPPPARAPRRGRRSCSSSRSSPARSRSCNDGAPPTRATGPMSSRVAAVSRSVVDRQADLGLLLAAAAYRLDHDGRHAEHAARPR